MAKKKTAAKTNQAPALTTEQAPALTTDQVAALTTEQAPALTTHEDGAITATCTGKNGNFLLFDKGRLADLHPGNTLVATVEGKQVAVTIAMAHANDCRAISTGAIPGNVGGVVFTKK